MKIVYSLPHPSDRLDSEQAGHVVRARSMLNALAKRGHEIVHVEAAAEKSTRTAVSIYRKLFKKMLPRPIAMRLRDTARISHGKRYAERLIATIQRARPDVILETHIAFSLAGKLAAEQTGLPLVLDDVAPAWEEHQQYGVGLADAALDIHRQITTTASLLVAVSPTIRRLLLQSGLPESKVISVPNGIDANLFQAAGIDGKPIRAQYGIADSACVIGFVGSFQHYHRVELLIEAFAALLADPQPADKQRGKPHLLLVGDGMRAEACRSLVDQRGLRESVTFTGTVPYSTVPTYVAACDLTVVPASNDFGNSMKIYEYAAMGKPVIAPDQETMRDQITHGETGWLFQRDDASALADALRHLITSPELRARLSAAGRRMAQECTWEKRAEVLDHALQQILTRS